MLGGEHVEGAAGGPPRLVVGDARHPQPHRGIEDREVDPELVQPLVEQPRQEAGRAVTRVARGRRPERFLGQAPPLPLGHRQRERLAHTLANRREALGRPVAADAAQLLDDHRTELQPVAVGVDDGMAQLASNLDGAGMFVTAHGPPPGRGVEPHASPRKTSRRRMSRWNFT